MWSFRLRNLGLAAALTICAASGGVAFAWIDSTVFRSDRLRGVGRTYVVRGLAIPTLHDHFVWWRQQTAFDPFVFIEARRALLESNEGDLQIGLVRTTGGLFDVLGARFEAGQEFRSEDFEPLAPLVAVLEARLAEQLFGTPQQSIGRSIVLERTRYKVVGVAASGVAFVPGIDVLIPRPHGSPLFAVAGNPASFEWIGRLRVGRRPSEARAEFLALKGRLDQESSRTGIAYGDDIAVRTVPSVMLRPKAPLAMGTCALAVLLGVGLWVWPVAPRGLGGRRIVIDETRLIATFVGTSLAALLAPAVCTEIYTAIQHTSPIEAGAVWPVFTSTILFGSFLIVCGAGTQLLNVSRSMRLVAPIAVPQTVANIVRRTLVTCVLLLGIAGGFSAARNRAASESAPRSILLRALLSETTSPRAIVDQLPNHLQRGWVYPAPQHDVPVRSAIVEGSDRLTVDVVYGNEGALRTLGVTLEQGTFKVDTAQGPVAVVTSSVARRLWGTDTALGKRVSLERRSRSVGVVGIAADRREPGGRHATSPPAIYLLDDGGLSRSARPTTVVAACGKECELAIDVFRRAVLEAGGVFLWSKSLQDRADGSAAPERIMHLALASLATTGLLLALMGSGGRALAAKASAQPTPRESAHHGPGSQHTPVTNGDVDARVESL